MREPTWQLTDQLTHMEHFDFPLRRVGKSCFFVKDIMFVLIHPFTSSETFSMVFFFARFLNTVVQIPLKFDHHHHHHGRREEDLTGCAKEIQINLETSWCGAIWMDPVSLALALSLRLLDYCFLRCPTPEGLNFIWRLNCYFTLHFLGTNEQSQLRYFYWFRNNQETRWLGIEIGYLQFTRNENNLLDMNSWRRGGGRRR